MSRKKAIKEIKDKKTKKTTKPKTKTSKTKSKKTNSKKPSDDNVGIIVIEDDLKSDKSIELEERRAYLEEARSQEAFD